MQNRIVLITDDEKVSQKIEKQIILLRKNDIFQTIEFKNCFDTVKSIMPVMIIYHLKKTSDENYSDIEGDIFLNFLQKVNQTKELMTCSVVLLYEEMDENLLCSAFEKGLSDFISISASETELTIRTIWNLQKRENLFEISKKNEILTQLKIVEEKSNAYTENYTYTILKEESKNSWGTFVSISPDINVRSKISPQTLMNTIKKVVRNCDILGYASDFKIYLWFSETEKENVLKILEKIKNTLTEDYTISAGYTETKDIDFDIAESLANKALSKALLKGNCFICAKKPQNKNTELKMDIKNYKLQKENAVKKLESIISPIFYQFQKRYEVKLFETQITQSVNKEYSDFSLENEKGKGTFLISYSGYTKVNIEIIHDINDEDLKADKIFVDTDELTESKIEYFLEKFIKDFKNYTGA